MTDTDKENQNKESQEKLNKIMKNQLSQQLSNWQGVCLILPVYNCKAMRSTAFLNKVSEKLGKKLDSKLLVVVSFDSDIKIDKNFGKACGT